MPDFPTIKPFILPAILVILWTAQTISPIFAHRDDTHRHARANMALGLFNWIITFTLFATATQFVLEYSATHTLGLLHHLPTTTPTYANWIIAFIIMDFWKYLWHRINHRIPFLWKFHAVHHSDSQMDVTSAIRFHTIEILISAVALLILNPLFGVSLTQLAAYETAFLACVMFQHANLKFPLPLDRFLRLFIVTPRMHFVHHSDYQPETDSNYSSLFTIWDRLLGTYRINDDTTSITLGLKNYSDEESLTLTGMILSPFTPHDKDN